MRHTLRLILVVSVALGSTDCTPATVTVDEAEIAQVLDRLHAAAAAADGPGYFAHFTPDAVFFGTAASERWPISEFEPYARARFDAGDGWTYRVTGRNVFASEDGRTAWFDEALFNVHNGTEDPRFGETRGTGVLVKGDGAWKIAQYHLTIPIPDELTFEVVELIRSAERP